MGFHANKYLNHVRDQPLSSRLWYLVDFKNPFRPLLLTFCSKSFTRMIQAAYTQDEIRTVRLIKGEHLPEGIKNTPAHWRRIKYIPPVFPQPKLCSSIQRDKDFHRSRVIFRRTIQEITQWVFEHEGQRYHYLTRGKDPVLVQRSVSKFIRKFTGSESPKFFLLTEPLNYNTILLYGKGLTSKRARWYYQLKRPTSRTRHFQTALLQTEFIGSLPLPELSQRNLPSNRRVQEVPPSNQAIRRGGNGFEVKRAHGLLDD